MPFPERLVNECHQERPTGIAGWLKSKDAPPWRATAVVARSGETLLPGAADSLCRALAIRDKSLGPSHPDLAQPHPRGTTCRFVFRQRRPTKGESLGVERIVRHATQLLKFHRAAASARTSSRKEVIIETLSGSEVGGGIFRIFQ